jgi:hypothetical protein
MTDAAWLNAFGAAMNSGTNSATVVAGNGSGNYIGGNVTADASQSIGDSGHCGPFPPPCEPPPCHPQPPCEPPPCVPHPLPPCGGEPPPCGPCGPEHGWEGFGGLNFGSNSATVIAGNGIGNFIGGNVTADANQHIGDHSFPVLF